MQQRLKRFLIFYCLKRLAKQENDAAARLCGG